MSSFFLRECWNKRAQFSFWTTVHKEMWALFMGGGRGGGRGSRDVCSFCRKGAGIASAQNLSQKYSARDLGSFRQEHRCRGEALARAIVFPSRPRPTESNADGMILRWFLENRIYVCPGHWSKVTGGRRNPDAKLEFNEGIPSKLSEIPCCAGRCEPLRRRSGMRGNEELLELLHVGSRTMKSKVAREQLRGGRLAGR